MDAATIAAARPVRRLVASGAGKEPQLILHGRGSPLRAELERFISDEYRKHFDADVREFMPTFLALHDATGRISAAVGCRSAAFEKLFLEIYTDKPIEAMITERVSVEVPREQIVEIGSLACRNGRSAMAIIRALSPYLIDAGFSWAAFTASSTVVTVLSRLRLEPLALCVAHSSKLGPSRSAWGSYYKHDPVVMAGRLRDGIEALDDVPRIQ